VVGNMKRKIAPSTKTSILSLALFGICVFLGVGLIALPIIIGMMLVVAYIPVGVAIFLPIAYMTRQRWTPWIKKHTDRYLASPELDRMQARVDRKRAASKPPPRVYNPNRPASSDSRDLRDAGRP